MSLSPIEQLATWRQIGARRSEEVLELAPKVLRRGAGDQEWAIREQLVIAALDLGKLKIATAQIELLQERFRKSPRVTLLSGLRHEALGELQAAKDVYTQLLAIDETNVSAHQRLITLSQSSSPVSQTISHLLTYFDTFYSDPSGWSLLADLYISQGLYAQALAALGHLMVLQTWDSTVLVKAAEVAYTMGDYELALKYFLRGAEMEAEPPSTSSDTGKNTRTWWGVQLCTRKLLAKRTNTESTVPPHLAVPETKLQALSQLATERILAAGGAHLDITRTVLSGSGNLLR